MSLDRTSKSLSERVEINFHHRPNRMRQRRWFWSLAALAFALSVPALAAFRGDCRLYQAGPVSQAHRLIANDCGKCHDESWQTLARLARLDDRRVSTSDTACTVCHAGAKHHENQLELSCCALCHREHRGQAPLARLDDAACVHCHRDLRTTKGATKDFVAAIIDFDGHPEFAVKRAPGGATAPGPEHKVRDVARKNNKGEWEDKAAIRFNHRAHLPSGGVLQLDGSRKELSCEECHQTDRVSGYMLPINHDRHCARCHENELNFDYLRGAAARPSGDGAQVQNNNDQRERADVVHGSLAQVRAKLIEFYTNYLTSHPQGDPRPLPDEVPRHVPGPEPPLTEEGWAWVQGRLDDAQRLLLGNPLVDKQYQHGCRYCHTEVSKRDGGWVVERPNIPSRWLKHARFRHDRHTLLACTECHPGVGGSSDTTDVLLPGIATCRNCHTATPASGAAGVARTDCVECHGYHDHSSDLADGPLSLKLDEVAPEHRRRPPSMAAP